MKTKTDFEAIKSTAKLLCDAVKIEPSNMLCICCHPYTTTTITMTPKGTLIDLTKKEDYKKWRAGIFDMIDKRKDLSGIMALIGDAWYLTFLKLIKEYLTLEDFSKLFGECWVLQENPNGDVNVSLKTAVNWFREAIPKFLMTNEDLQVFNTFDKGLTVYRGVAVGRKSEGLSWTTSYKKAEWFAHRFDRSNEKGYVQKLVIKDKNNILAYFTTRGEEEVVIDTFKENNYEKFPLYMV